MTEDPHEFETGATLAHYRVEERLGEGAMGIVYRARDTSLERDVALKVLKAGASDDAVFVRRFVREARAAARVAHTNLAHIYFIGEQEGTHFFAMEYVEGRDLDEVVRQDGPLSLGAAVDVLVQAARGLAAAHRAGVVHRDVKPSNLLLQTDGTIRVSDFGLAKSYDLDLDATQPGQILGTPRFMSPEQCRGEKADARCDIYALGLTAYYALAGRDPYETKSLGALINDQINTPLPRLSDDNEDIPEEIDDVLQVMCAKDPAARSPDLETVIERLEACRPHPVPPAPFMTRAIAAGVDLLLTQLPFAFLQLALVSFLDLKISIRHPAIVVMPPVVFGLYHLICDARWGQTIGKWLFGIQARAASGFRMRARAVIPRLLVRYPILLFIPVDLFDAPLPLEVAGYGIQAGSVLGATLAYFIAGNRTISDLVTRTCVTYRIARGQGRSSATK